jgi:hypothetical protein
MAAEEQAEAGRDLIAEVHNVEPCLHGAGAGQGDGAAEMLHCHRRALARGDLAGRRRRIEGAQRDGNQALAGRGEPSDPFRARLRLRHNAEQLDIVVGEHDRVVRGSHVRGMHPARRSAEP